MNKPTLVCPQCGNTAEPQPLDQPIWCIRDNKHDRRFYVLMIPQEEAT